VRDGKVATMKVASEADGGIFGIVARIARAR
jgi:hypothetical protein